MSKEILILGAGACGLMAGALLAEKGYKVTVIEARDRIGGRIHTIKNPSGGILDLGAEFIHGDQPLTTQIIRDTGNKIIPVSGEMYRITDGKKSESDFFGDEWNAVLEALHELKEDTDIASFLNQYFTNKPNQALYQSVKGFVEGYDAADMNKVSAFALREEWSETDDDDQARMEGGYLTVINYLYEKLIRHSGRVVLSTCINKIEWSKGKVKLFDNRSTTFEAEKVIVTVPLGVLINDDIHFSPHILEHESAYRQLGFGGVIKFCFEFSEEVWSEILRRRKMKDMSFVFTDAQIPTWWTQFPLKKTLLTGWLGGPSTFRINHNPEYLYDVATASLSYIFDYPVQAIKDGLASCQIADWVNDPFSKGAYSYQTLHTQKALDLLLTPIKDTIYFSGEAFYKGKAMGTVEAALASGREVAMKL